MNRRFPRSVAPAGPVYDQLHRPELLRQAWRLVQQGGPAGGVDAVSLAEFHRCAGSQLPQIADRLARRQFRFQPVRRTFIKKLSGGRRQLGIPTIADRVVAQAVRLVLEPLFEPRLAAASFAYRPGRSVHQAIDRLLALREAGRAWMLESDVADFFDSIDHQRLMGQLQQLVRDPDLLELIRQHLRCGAQLGPLWRATRRGVAQGSPLSPLLSNLYLDSLDQALLSSGYELVRYADDFVIGCATRGEAERAERQVVRQLAGLGLRINPKKTRILDARREPLEFLGFLVHPRYLWPVEANVRRFRQRVDQLTAVGQPLEWDELLEQLNPLVRSFAHYYRRCRVVKLYAELDAHVRRRLGCHLERLGRRRPRNQDQWRALGVASLTEILFRAEPDPAPRHDSAYGWQPPRAARARQEGRP